MKLRVHVTPNARHSEMIGWDDTQQGGRVLKIRITASPVDGAANIALRDFLAKMLGVSKSKVTLEKGNASRIKTFEIPDDVRLP